ncbi:antitoxin [Mycobacterium sp.]|uniref:antitoxin n=1 Tax=Mycobacterium sp. TaxID=1785 RepID=UPI0031D1370A
MRTTVTLDDDVVQLLRKRMKQQHVSFKTALNDAVRDAAAQRPRMGAFATRTADLGVPGINLDRALQVAAGLEDEELIRRQRRRA